MDDRMAWQDRKRSVLYRVISSFVSAATLPERKKFDVFLVDNLHFAPVLMKLLFLNRKKQKIVAHLGSHTLYFLFTHRFSPLVERLHLWALRRYDALLCEGDMAQDLARRLLGERCPPTYVTFLGPPASRAEALRRVQPKLDGRRILLIAHGPTSFRSHYKGLDLMVDAFARAGEVDASLDLQVVGDWDPEVVEACLRGRPDHIRGRIDFSGRVDDVPACLAAAALYLHCARGDAFPTSSLEAMAAGVVPMVSEWTGTREVVRNVDERLVVPLDSAEIANRIAWYFHLDAPERARLSRRSREAVAGYTEEKATAHYRDTFRQVCRDLGLAAATP